MRERRGEGKRNGHAHTAEHLQDADGPVLHSYARLADATVSRSLFPVCLNTCKHSLNNTLITNGGKTYEKLQHYNESLGKNSSPKVNKCRCPPGLN
jgi:hypothetical protein